MARQSTASLTVVRASPDSRLAPAAGLDAEEIELWRDVVNTKPAEWFADDSAPLLKEYVRAAVMCDRLDLQIKDAIASDDLGVVKALLDMRDKESKRVLSIATKLRLTQQSRYTPQAASTANKKASGARPWQFGGK